MALLGFLVTYQSLSLWPQSIIAGALLWMSWYTWTFFLVPWWNSDEPKELPYWIPVIGHIKKMMTDAHGLISYGREYFGNTREPFSMTVMGQSMYFVTSPDDVVTVYKNPVALDYNPFIKEVFLGLGLSQPTIDKMYDENYKSGKHFVDVMHENFKLQMHPGEKLDILQTSLLGYIYDALHWGKLSSLAGHSNDSNEKIVSLYKWSEEVVVDAATRAFLDPVIYELAPDLLPEFAVFDVESWKLALEFPDFAARRMYASKRYMEKAMTKYMALPEEKRSKESWLIRTMINGLNELGLDPQDSAPAFFTLYRTTNINAHKIAFWLMAYMLFDNDLLSRIRAEILSGFGSSDSLNITYLLESCPLLNSAYEETLRITDWPVGVRTVMAPFTLHGKRLRPGRKLLMHYRQMHFDPAVFGDDATCFNPERFMRNKSLERSTSYRPFGGAGTYCPGRFLARREILLFVAVLLKRFDISLVEKNGKAPRFPRLDDGLPTGGVIAPVFGDDVLLKVRPLKS
ncbi:cytochrome P450 [Glonium stellatum]|uniref:Cytochrome P450 n=1 Tax=Glonium stellatum TaxID=574774 RepID=A0A8E2EP92_9PEZI|nr:cytochrome P450 [Glonium stellatum]